MPPERDLVDAELWSMVSLGSSATQDGAKDSETVEQLMPGPALPDKDRPPDLTTRDIWRNLIAICLSFTLSYTAFQSIQNLESSLNEEAYVGTASLSCIYGIFILSCNLAPWMISRIGTKWNIVLGLLGNAVYTAVHFHSHHYTLIPASILLGAVIGPMWAASSTHLIVCAARYAHMTKEQHNVVISQFMGIFYMAFGSTQIFGNLISASVLEDASGAATDNETSTSERTCGSQDYRSVIDASHLPTKNSQITLFSVYLAISLMAIVAIIPLDTLARIKGADSVPASDAKVSIACLCVTALQMLKNPKVLMLTPFLVYCGMEQAFLFGEFTKSYVSCAIGVESVGVVMICYGACDAVFAFVAGRLAKYTGQNPLLMVAAMVTFLMMIMMLAWQPSPRDYALFFLITGGWGLADGIWQTQLSAVMGELFANQTEAIFSLSKMLQSSGFAVTFAYSGAMPVYGKLIILILVLIASIVGYSMLQVNLRGKELLFCGRQTSGYSVTQV